MINSFQNPIKMQNDMEREMEKIIINTTLIDFKSSTLKVLKN